MLPGMRRFKLMSSLGLAEPLVRLARSVESSNRRAASKQIEVPDARELLQSNRDHVARPPGDAIALPD